MMTELATTLDTTTAQPAADPAGRLPAIYLGHGAPPLLEDAGWMGELSGWVS